MSTLERRTPLKPGRPLARKSGLSRNRPIPRPAEQRNNRKPRVEPTAPTRRPRPPRHTGASRSVRDLVTARDRGRCVLCGAPATNIHHRRNRGMGGRRGPEINSPANLLSLCGSGTTGCHGQVTNDPDGRYAEIGYRLSTNNDLDPAVVPVRAWDGWHLYDHDGGRRRSNPFGELA